MPDGAVNPSARRAFVLDSFRVHGAKTPHGSPQTARELIPYCEEIICEGLYEEVMDAVVRQGVFCSSSCIAKTCTPDEAFRPNLPLLTIAELDPALSSIAGVSDEYLLWAVDMTMYYFVISSLKARGIVNSLDATGYFTFQFPKPDKWVLADQAASNSTAAFGQWMAQRQDGGSKLQLVNETTAMEMDSGAVVQPLQSSTADGIDLMADKLASQTKDDMDELVDFMKQVVL